MHARNHAKDVPVRLANVLRLAATPTFAVLALLTGFTSGDVAATICSGIHDGILAGMGMMYLLMAVFHAPPWLTIGRR